MMETDVTWPRLKLYEFLATPAHLWLWVVARICGGSFT
ncbi:hypothetical protein LCGC14_2784720, partial [marine sediment metagenome]